MKICICGGHLTPALALIDYIQKDHPEDELFFIGTEYTQKKNKQLSQEKKETKERDVPFYPLDTAKITELQSRFFLGAILKLLTSTITSFKILIKNKPNAVVAFGGYLSLPVAIAAKILGIPVIVHEQTKAAGRANILVSKIASKVALSHSCSSKFFPKNKTVVTGNLIRPQLFDSKVSKPEWLETTITKEKPLLYVTGGNQGSQVINSTISQILPQLTNKWTIIHQCGNPLESQNYYSILQKQRNQLSENKQKKYYVQKWITTNELTWIYQNAACIISRSGANTTDEISAFHIPAILIPLPFAYHNEQLLNAQALADKKLARIIHQKDLNPESLLKVLTYMRNNYQKVKKNKEQISKDYLKPHKKLYSLINEKN